MRGGGEEQAGEGDLEQEGGGPRGPGISGVMLSELYISRGKLNGGGSGFAAHQLSLANVRNKAET